MRSLGPCQPRIVRTCQRQHCLGFTSTTGSLTEAGFRICQELKRDLVSVMASLVSVFCLRCGSSLQISPILGIHPQTTSTKPVMFSLLTFHFTLGSICTSRRYVRYASEQDIRVSCWSLFRVTFITAASSMRSRLAFVRYKIMCNGSRSSPNCFFLSNNRFQPCVSNKLSLLLFHQPLGV